MAENSNGQLRDGSNSAHLESPDSVPRPTLHPGNESITSYLVPVRWARTVEVFDGWVDLKRCKVLRVGRWWALYRTPLGGFLEYVYIPSIPEHAYFVGKAGVGICLGPGRALDGSWLIDLEGDGPRAAESLAILLGGEIIPTMGWPSTRGEHALFKANGKRLLELLNAAAALQGKGHDSGKFTLPTLPDLELRIGRFDPDGSVMQFQSNVPPTPGTDDKPRQWNGIATIAELPEAAYAMLDGIAERIAMTKADEVDHTAYQEGGSSNGNGSNRNGATVETRAIAYLAKLAPAIAGQGGHKVTMRAACSVVRFGLDDPETVFRLLRDHYNDLCQPPWSESELRHKAEEACKTEKRRDLAHGRGKAAAMSRNGDEQRHGTKVNNAIDDPHRLVQIFKDKHKAPNCDGVSMMIFYRGEYHRWRESSPPTIPSPITR